MELESILIILALGAVVGWLAGLIVKGGGFGLIVNIVVGIAGAFVGNFVFGYLGISVGSGMVSALVSALAGAVILVVIISLLRKLVPDCGNTRTPLGLCGQWFALIGPAIRSGHGGVEVIHEPLDLGGKVLERGEVAAANDLTGQDAKPDLDLIEP